METKSDLRRVIAEQAHLIKSLECVVASLREALDRVQGNHAARKGMETR